MHNTDGYTLCSKKVTTKFKSLYLRHTLSELIILLTPSIVAVIVIYILASLFWNTVNTL